MCDYLASLLEKPPQGLRGRQDPGPASTTGSSSGSSSLYRSRSEERCLGIEEFYTLLSGEIVELNRFVDLSAMAAAVGFKLRARNMTALGVQVLGTVLNKTV